jgi:hypothetical protein
MFEIPVRTTDRTFVEDLNSAGIEGVRADYRPTMAYDSAAHVLSSPQARRDCKPPRCWWSHSGGAAIVELKHVKR